MHFLNRTARSISLSGECIASVVMVLVGFFALALGFHEGARSFAIEAGAEQALHLAEAVSDSAGGGAVSAEVVVIKVVWT